MNLATSESPHKGRLHTFTQNVDIREIEAAFVEAARSIGGLNIDRVIADGKIHRAKVDGDGKRETSGVYVLHLDGVAAGRFWNHRQSERSGKWVSGLALTPEQRVQIRAEAKENSSRREEETLEAARGRTP